jgi:drug/metabolite transporter (DMT)-like permease
MEPTAPPIIGATRPNSDLEHLRLLAIFHYVVGGLHILAASILILHVSVGLLLILRPGFFGNNPPPPFVGLFMTVMFGILMVCGWAMGVCTILSGRYLSRRVHRTFSMVVAVVNCLGFPFGTALGVCTIIVLSRDSVRNLYENR